MNFEVSHKKYIDLLPPRFMSALTYEINQSLSNGVTGNTNIYKSKQIPSITFSGILKPIPLIGLVASYTIQNYSFNSIGAGFYIGKSPIQFYMVSDNIMAAFKPLDVRNVNLRFGLNINLGCSIKEKTSPENKGSNQACFAYKDMDKNLYLKTLKKWNQLNKGYLRKANNPTETKVISVEIPK